MMDNKNSGRALMEYCMNMRSRRIPSQGRNGN